MRTFSKLLSAPLMAGLLGAVAMTASVPATARDYDRYGGRHWSGHHEYHHWRGGRDWDDYGPNVSFGFYGGYPYYNSDYYGYYGSPYYGCDNDGWYGSDDCYGSYYGDYDWDD